MAKLKEIIPLIELIAPLNLAESWDNSGLQIGDPDQEISKIAVTLDPDYEIINQCSEKNIDLLISHHPFFFSGVKTLNFSTLQGKFIRHAIENKIAVYSAHTSLDSAKGGLNDFLFEKLNITPTEPIIPCGDENDSDGLGRMGITEKKVSARSLAEKLKKILNIRQVKIIGNMDAVSNSFGVCTGSGSGLIKAACEKGAEIYITGDVKYHEARDAAEMGMCVIDGGHYGTEFIVCELLKKTLEPLIKDKGFQIEVEELLNEDVFKIF